MDHHRPPDGCCCDAIDMLVADHGKVDELFEEFAILDALGAPRQVKQDLVQEICSELRAHEQLEDEVFFPAVRDVLREENILEDAVIEQNDAGELIAELARLDVREHGNDCQVIALGADISAHAVDEEIEVFPLVRESQIDTQVLGHRMADRRDQMLNESARAEPVASKGGTKLPRSHNVQLLRRA